MKRDNIERANVLVKAIAEIEDFIEGFKRENTNANKPVTFDSHLLDIRFQVWGNGNTVGDRLTQKYNGVVGCSTSTVSNLTDREEYIEVVSSLTKKLREDYILELHNLKNHYEQELEKL